MVLAQKQNYRLTGQDREFRTCGYLIYEKEAKIYNGEDSLFSVGKTGQLYVKK